MTLSVLAYLGLIHDIIYGNGVGAQAFPVRQCLDFGSSRVLPRAAILVYGLARLIEYHLGWHEGRCKLEARLGS
jgi:hypothetical protein